MTARPLHPQQEPAAALAPAETPVAGEEEHAELVIPLLVVGAIVLVAIGFRLARRDVGRGPHPDNPSGGTR